MNMVLTLWAPEAARVHALSAAILVLPGCNLLTLAAVADPLRAAGARVRLLSPDGMAIATSAGVTLQVQGHAGQLAQAELVVILGGEAPLPPRLCEDLRFAASLGLRLMAAGSGVRLLAEAGLLQGRRFSSAVPLEGLEPQPEPFTLDDRLATCPDGPVAADVMMHLLRDLLGPAALPPILMACTLPPPRAPQDLPRPLCGPPALKAALRMMAQDFPHPDLLIRVERATKLSRRQLERLFAANLGTSPVRHLTHLRLAEARRLLAQTTLAIPEVAARAGFTTTAQFSRLYRRQTGVSPHKTTAGI